ncbi:hypothetical protein CLV71_11270 [Actinophytocola oryzae]|uniref:Uncharacterized protein n=1 Tax=Actinophytocola oryzae TaxID=502181 RepID=A0A4R7V923_9PSEU|nr:hypothetical protein CLV71_11270 [Actinophytocola oryzae]
MKARVTDVGVSPAASAARWSGFAPLSGQGRNIVPSCAALAPATSTAATSAPLDNPPAATSGTSTAADTLRSNGIRPVWSVPSLTKEPRWAPASWPCTHRPSAPEATASRASAADVTVTSTSQPCAFTSAMTSDEGHPNVKLTTGTLASDSNASLASQASSPPTGSPSGTPYRSASPRSAAAYASTAEASTGVRSGTNTLSPNGLPVNARVASTCARTASAVR